MRLIVILIFIKYKKVFLGRIYSDGTPILFLGIGVPSEYMRQSISSWDE